MAASKLGLGHGIPIMKLRPKKYATMGQMPPPLPLSHSASVADVGPISAQVITTAQSPATQGQPTHSNERKSSDQRFRSFTERYVVARAHLLTVDPLKLAEEQYAMVLDAKRFYAMIERAGQNIQPEDGVF